MIALERARTVAQAVTESILDTCLSVHLAGSAVRQVDQVRDVDLVVIPKPPTKWPLLGRLQERWDVTNKELHGRTKCVTIAWRDPAVKVEVWLARPETLGLILMIRTGPADFSKRFVTALHFRGLKSEGGYLMKTEPLLDAGLYVDCPDEQVLWKLLGIRWIPPQFRCASVLQMELRIAGIPG